MQRRKIIWALSVAAMLAATITPAHGADATIATPDLSMTISIPDVYFDGPDAVTVPVTCSYVKLGRSASLVSGTLRLDANQNAAANGISGSGSVQQSGPLQWTGVGLSLRVYPSQLRASRGPLIITGTLKSTVITGTSYETQVPPLTVQLHYDTSTVTAPRVKYVKESFPYWRITGMATAQTLTRGVLPAGGTLTLQVKKPTSKHWVSSLSTRADNFGEYEFRLQPASKFPKGTRLRVVLRDCGWCTDALAAGRV